jgi:hypothetical protein
VQAVTTERVPSRKARLAISLRSIIIKPPSARKIGSRKKGQRKQGQVFLFGFLSRIRGVAWYTDSGEIAESFFRTFEETEIEFATNPPLHSGLKQE